MEVKGRLPCKIVLYHVPDETDKSELRELLQGWISELQITDINVVKPNGCKPNKTGVWTLMGFVEFAEDEMAVKVIQFYMRHKNNVGTRGYIFTNSKGVTSEMTLQYNQRKDSSTDNNNNKNKALKNKNSNRDENNNTTTNCNNNSNNNSSSINNGHDGNNNITHEKVKFPPLSAAMQNIVQEIADIKEERKAHLETIESLEAILKSRVPEELYVSMRELDELQEKDQHLNEMIAQKKERVESGRRCVGNVRAVNGAPHLEQLSLLSL